MGSRRRLLNLAPIAAADSRRFNAPLQRLVGQGPVRLFAAQFRCHGSLFGPNVSPVWRHLRAPSFYLISTVVMAVAMIDGKIGVCQTADECFVDERIACTILIACCCRGALGLPPLRG